MGKLATGLLVVVMLFAAPAVPSFARGGGGHVGGHSGGGHAMHGGGGIRGGGNFRGGQGFHGSPGVHGGFHGGHGGFHGGHGGFRGGVFIGAPLWWDPWWWGLGYPYAYAYYPPAYAGYPPYGGYPPADQPSEYAERQAPVEPQPQGYWYYCPRTKDYYPNVETCAERWIKVPPAPPEGQE